MIKSKIFVTGGSGKAGKHLIPYLLELGYSVVNADLIPLLIDGVDNINLDITDSGQLFNALSGYANIPELKSGEGLKSFKAVVHLAAIPRILIKPDNETFRINTLGTYNVIEAATKLGIKKIILLLQKPHMDFVLLKEIQSLNGCQYKRTMRQAQLIVMDFQRF